MEQRRRAWGAALITAVLTWTAVGCTAAPLEREPPGEAAPGPGGVDLPEQEAADEAEGLEPEEELSAQ